MKNRSANAMRGRREVGAFIIGSVSLWNLFCMQVKGWTLNYFLKNIFKINLKIFKNFKKWKINSSVHPYKYIFSLIRMHSFGERVNHRVRWKKNHISTRWFMTVNFFIYDKNRLCLSLIGVIGKSELYKVNRLKLNMCARNL